jgi:hypothetical protein
MAVHHVLQQSTIHMYVLYCIWDIGHITRTATYASTSSLELASCYYSKSDDGSKEWYYSQCNYKKKKQSGALVEE